MRIAHFIHRYPPAPGGSESYFARLSRYLAEQGEEVTVFTTTALDLSAFWSPAGQCTTAGRTLEDDVTVLRYPLWRFYGRRYVLKPLSLIPHRFWQCLTLPCNPICWAMWNDVHEEAFDFDAIHATAFPYAFPIVCALQLARRLGVPFFLTPFLHLGDPNNPHDPTRKAYTSSALVSLLQTADGIFVQTRGEKQALLDLGIPRERLHLQGLGVDASECTGGNREQTRTDWNIPGKTVAIGHLANQSAEKGTVDLLKAAALLWEQGMSFYVVLAGPEMANFQHFWKNYPHKEKVIRLGRISDEDKRRFFAAIDIFALPSRSDSFGLVLLEAWANGIPNLAYRAGGIADVIHHDRDGLLVPCGDVLSLAEQMQRLILAPSLREQLGRVGQRRTTSEFLWPDKLRLVKTCLQRATSQSKAA